ncbi:TIGR04222 domain-containing membrane protein [Streptomyces sp. PU-14G]|uniref:TIGR04222 domain-containing membrane protein n=1 Tax=Streptomyces sp. PU-14G TaxID=2800808 RepID=UPI0034DF20D9
MEDDASLLETADLRYLALCAALLLAAGLIRTLVYVALRPWRAARPAPCTLDRYDVALLTGGFERVVASALAGLADAGAVTLHPGAVSEIRPTTPARAAQDPVQEQVLDLLSDHPNGHRLSAAFSRTAIAAAARDKLVSSGIMLPHRWRFVLARFFSGALTLLAMSATVVVQWGRLPMDKFSGLLFLELMMCGVYVGLCAKYLPLTLSQQGAELVARLRQAADPEPSADLPGHAGGGAPDTPEGADVPEGADIPGDAGGWRLEPGWTGSPAGRVALGGWDEYRDTWGQPYPLRFWELVPDNVDRTPEEHHRRSVLYRALGVVCGLLAIPCAVVSFTGAFWVGAFWLLFAWAGARCAVLARKHRAAGSRGPYRATRGPGADAAYDPRPSASYPHRPGVLYLRSFAHHDASLERTAPWQNIKTAILGSDTSYVEELARTLRHFGPPVAIGAPGAALPGLGPAQFFVPPDPHRGASGAHLERWQAEVLTLMDGAALVVIAAGLGEGLLWEFRQATSRLPPHRLVVMVPLDREGYALFREHAGACFRRGLPADPREPNRRGEIDHALLYFDDDWTPRFAEFADHPMIQLHLGRIATRFSVRRYRNQLTHAAYPVFRANGVRWPGIEVPVPFGRASRQRLLPGVSLGLAAAVLALGGPAVVLGLWPLL